MSVLKKYKKDVLFARALRAKIWCWVSFGTFFFTLFQFCIAAFKPLYTLFVRYVSTRDFAGKSFFFFFYFRSNRYDLLLFFKSIKLVMLVLTFNLTMINLFKKRDNVYL